MLACDKDVFSGCGFCTAKSDARYRCGQIRNFGESMKRIIALCLLTICVFLTIGCNSNVGHNSDTPDLLSGNYNAVGDYEEMLTPYFWINTENNEFQFGPGAVISYVEHGTYEVKNGVIIAASQTTTFRFEIKDAKTLILIENGDNDYFKIPINTQFVFSDNQ